MKVLDLFSGIGGFSLGLERAGMETVAFCEIDPFCQKVLKKHWPNKPIYEDVRSLDYEGSVDLICGGFPCQPFSVAGKQKGDKDDRHLWPAMFELIKKYRPAWFIGENVVGFINMALDNVLSQLESEGYETRAFVLPACAVGAPHRRERVWIVANTKSEFSNVSEPKTGKHSDKQKPQSGKRILKNNTSNAYSERLETQRAEQQAKGHKGSLAADNISQRTQGIWQEQIQGIEAFSWCEDIRRIEDYFKRPDLPKPLICREDDGFSQRVDRLRSLGNAVVPQIPEILGHAIMEAHHGT